MTVRKRQDNPMNAKKEHVKMIRSLLGTAAVSGLALCSTFSGFAQNTGFYLTGGIGPALTEDTSVREYPGLGPVPGTKVKFDPGFQFRIAAGYHITEWLATELETGVSYNRIKYIRGATEANA